MTPSTRTGFAASAPSRRRSFAAPVLVVEDEALIALDLARQIEDDGGAVLGPAETAEAALALLAAAPEVGGAVLDIRLSGGTGFAVASALARRRIPFVFYTAYDTLAPPEFANAPVVEKTRDWRAIKRALYGAPPGRLRAEVETLLPGLRAAARRIADDDEAADRLVERTLARAAADVDVRGHYPSVSDWLLHLMKHAAFGRDPGHN